MIFALLQKAFVVLLISKFIHRVGDSGSILPGEQLNQFRKMWRSMRKGKNQKTMPLKTLRLFLANLKVGDALNCYCYCYYIVESLTTVVHSLLSGLRGLAITTTTGQCHTVPCHGMP
jgi:hypothetical protein